MPEDLHKLWQKIREHPDFLFGAIYEVGDLEGRSLTKADFSADDIDVIESVMCESADEFIDELEDLRSGS